MRIYCFNIYKQSISKLKLKVVWPRNMSNSFLLNYRTKFHYAINHINKILPLNYESLNLTEIANNFYKYKFTKNNFIYQVDF